MGALLVAIILSVAAPVACAGSLQAVINGRSLHINSERDWNENNYGLGFEYEFKSESRWIKTVLANGFHDSDDNMSYMAGAGLHRRLLASDHFADFYIDAGLTAFLMTREDVDGNKPFPGVLPSVTFGNRYVGFNLSYIPRAAVQSFGNTNQVDPDMDGVLFLQFKVRLDRWLLD